MTSINDLHSWLETPGGRIYVAEAGGYSQALNALVNSDLATRQDAYAYNTERQRNGLDPLPAAQAALAVAPRGGPQLSGPADAIRQQCRDPSWRISVSSDDSASGPITWDGRSRAIVDSVRAERGIEPLTS